MKVLVHHPKDAEAYRRLLREKPPSVTATVTQDSDEAARVIRDVDILFCHVGFPPELLYDAERLKWIQLMGAGVEKFTSSPLLPSGVRITRVTGTFGLRIAEYVAAYLFHTTQDVRRVVRNQHDRRWDPFVPQLLAGKVVGVAGLGSIGLAVTRKLAALNAVVHGLSGHPVSDPALARHYLKEELSSFLAPLDFVILCLPLTPQTNGMIGMDEFRQMKRTAYLVNVGRGALVDEAALIVALQQQEIAGAVLDVFADEPLPETSALWTLPTVVITPHLSGPSTPDEMYGAFLANLESFLRGHPMQNQVDLKKGY